MERLSKLKTKSNDLKGESNPKLSGYKYSASTNYATACPVI
jgi:hypothetical protein